MSSRRVKVERRVDPDFNEEKIDVSAQGAVLTPDLEDAVRAMFKNDLAPNEPVGVGASWELDDLETIFGPGTKGRLHMQFVRVETDANGRKVAVIQANGSTTTEVAAKMPSAASPGGGMDLVITATMAGSIRIDTTNGMVTSVELAGPARLEHAGSIGEPLVQNADFTYRWRSVAKAAPTTARIVNSPKPVEPVQDARDARATFAGTYRNDQLSIELAGAAGGPFNGTITIGDQKMPLTASADAQGIRGTFESAGNAFQFTATLDGDTLRFSTDGIEHTLKRS
jgi:hypothetical protein